MTTVRLVNAKDMFNESIEYDLDTGAVQPVIKHDVNIKIDGSYIQVGPSDYWGDVFFPTPPAIIFHNDKKYTRDEKLFCETEYIGPTQGRFRLYIDGKLVDETVYERVTPGVTYIDQEEDLDWFWQIGQAFSDRRSCWPHLIREDPEKPKRGLLKGLFKGPDK